MLALPAPAQDKVLASRKPRCGGKLEFGFCSLGPSLLPMQSGELTTAAARDVERCRSEHQELRALLLEMVPSTRDM